MLVVLPVELLAGYRWDLLRNVRSIRTLATPAGTVAVAIATVVGAAVASTAVASTAVAALLPTNPGSAPNQQQSTSTTSPTPGR